jgi:hypothetical protein
MLGTSAAALPGVVLPVRHLRAYYITDCFVHTSYVLRYICASLRAGCSRYYIQLRFAGMTLLFAVY